MNIIDVGGASKPFNKANYIIDILPYESYIGKKPGIAANGWFNEDGLYRRRFNFCKMPS